MLILFGATIRNSAKFLHYNQTGFIQNRNLKTNVSACISITQFAQKEKLGSTLMTVDLDHLEWSYL